jgi:hypothetical protein
LTTRGDKERARRLYAKAETLCVGIGDYEILVRSAAQQTGDPGVVREIVQSIESKFASAHDLRTLAECVLTYLSDEQWARRIYQKALQASDANQRMSELIVSIKNSLGDETWARKLY